MEVADLENSVFRNNYTKADLLFTWYIDFASW